MPGRPSSPALRRERRHVSSLALIVVGGILCAGVAFIYLDQPLCDLGKSWTGAPGCAFALLVATWLGNWQLGPLLIAIALIGSGLHWRRLLKTVFAAYVTRTLIVELLKTAAGRPRPRQLADAAVFEGFGGGSSFPSGHASFSFMLAIIVAAWFPRWRWVAWIGAIFVSVSRMLVHAHYLSDVIVGAIIGTVAGALFLWLWPPVTDETREAIVAQERRREQARANWLASFEGRGALARSRRRAMATLIVVLFIAAALISYWYIDPIPGFHENALFKTPLAQAIGKLGRHLGTWDLAPLLVSIALLAVGLHWRRLLITLLAGFAIQTAVTEIIKEMVGRPRPSQMAAPDVFYGPGTGFHSLPSGHASFIFLFVTVCAHYFPHMRGRLMTLGVLVAVSRVILGAHYVSDIIVGALIGVMSAWLVLAIWPRGQALDDRSEGKPAGEGVAEPDRPGDASVIGERTA